MNNSQRANYADSIHCRCAQLCVLCKWMSTEAKGELVKNDKLVGASPSFDYDMYQYPEDQSESSTGRASPLKLLWRSQQGPIASHEMTNGSFINKSVSKEVV